MIRESQTAFVFRQIRLMMRARYVSCLMGGVGAAACQGRGGVRLRSVGRPLVCAWRVSDFELTVSNYGCAMTSRAFTSTYRRCLVVMRRSDR